MVGTHTKVKPLRYSPAELMRAHGCHYITGGHGRIDVGGCYEGQKEATKEYARARGLSTDGLQVRTMYCEECNACAKYSVYSINTCGVQVQCIQHVYRAYSACVACMQQV
jgi:hypothetical protein